MTQPYIDPATGQWVLPPAAPAAYTPPAPAQYQQPAPAPQAYAQPPQYAAPPMPYAPQQYAPAGYPAPPPAPPLANGSLDAFYQQPSTGGGKALAFNNPGDRFVGVVVRDVTDGDVQQQTDTTGRPQTYRDGRPKFVMRVPLQMQPSPERPDGLAQWYVKGAARDELARAMGEHGESGAPKGGAVVDVTFTHTRQSGAGLNPAKMFRVVYTPAGQQPAAPQQYAPPQPPAAPLPPVQQPPANYPPAPAQPAAPAFMPPAQQSAPQYAQAPQPPVPPAPAAPQQPAGLPPMDADQLALLQRLSGQQPAAG